MKRSEGRTEKSATLRHRAARGLRTFRILPALLPLVTSTPLLLSHAYAAEDAPLTLDKRNVVAAPRSGKIVMLLALQEHREKLRGLPQADAERLLGETAKRYLTETFNNERYRQGFDNADVIFAFVDNMDEYNRPNFGGMKRVGTATFQREAGSLKQLSLQIDINALKQ